MKDSKRVKICNDYLTKDTIEEKISIDNCINNFFNCLVSMNKAPSTIAAYKVDIDQFKKFINNKKKNIEDIQPCDINRFKDRLFSLGCQYSTVKRKIDTLSALLKFCNDRGWIRYNPCNNIRLKKTSDIAVRYLEKEKLNLLLNAYTEDMGSNWLRNKTILYMLAFTGCRRSDVLNLKWQDIDLVKQMLVIKNQKNKVQIQLPIKIELLELLKEMFAIEIPNPDHYLIKGKDGNRLSDTAYNQIFKKACKSAGIDTNFNLTGHCLRHSFAVHLIRQGLDIPRVSKLLGHRDISTTIRYYHRIGVCIEKTDRDVFNNLYK